MDKMTRHIDVVLYDGVNILDVAGPVQAFAEARVNGRQAYAFRFVSATSTASQGITASCGLRLQTEDVASLHSSASDLLIPGGEGVEAQLGKAYWQQLLQSWQSTRTNARLISVCSGALLLADAGVLDNIQATTHWSRHNEVMRRYPAVLWNLDQILTSGKSIYTSAGVTTGIDLALHIIRQDCGTAAALTVARELIVYLQRSGGQSQYAQIVEWQLSAHNGIAALVNTIIENPGRQWTLESMADEAGTSSRTLTRKFVASFSISPMKFLEQIRVRLAGDMLSAEVPISRVASRCGFGDVQTLRRAYKRQLGTTLGEYINRFTSSNNNSNNNNNNNNNRIKA